MQTEEWLEEHLDLSMALELQRQVRRVLHVEGLQPRDAQAAPGARVGGAAHEGAELFRIRPGTGMWRAHGQVEHQKSIAFGRKTWGPRVTHCQPKCGRMHVHVCWPWAQELRSDPKIAPWLLPEVSLAMAEGRKPAQIGCKKESSLVQQRSRGASTKEPHQYTGFEIVQVGCTTICMLH